MVSTTCTLKTEVRTPTCSLHAFLTDNICLTRRALPFFVQTLLCKMEEQRPVCLGRDDRGEAEPYQQGRCKTFFQIPTLTWSASSSATSAFLWGLMDCFCTFIFAVSLTHGFVSRQKDVLQQTSSLTESQDPYLNRKHGLTCQHQSSVFHCWSVLKAAAATLSRAQNKLLLDEKRTSISML